MSVSHGPGRPPPAGSTERYGVSSAAGVEHLFAAIPVADIDAAIEWYTRLLERPPDLIPNDIEAAWRLTETAWIYVIVDEARAGSSLQSLLVADLDGLLGGLGHAGSGRLRWSGPAIRAGRHSSRTRTGTG